MAASESTNTQEINQAIEQKVKALQTFLSSQTSTDDALLNHVREKSNCESYENVRRDHLVESLCLDEGKKKTIIDVIKSSKKPTPGQQKTITKFFSEIDSDDENALSVKLLLVEKLITSCSKVIDSCFAPPYLKNQVEKAKKHFISFIEKIKNKLQEKIKTTTNNTSEQTIEPHISATKRKENHGITNDQNINTADTSQHVGLDFYLLLAANLVMSRLGIKTVPYRNLTELGADLSTLFANPANTITRDIDPAPASHDAGNIGRLFEGHLNEQPRPSSNAQAVTTAVNKLCTTQQIKFSNIKELLRNFKCDNDSLIQDSFSNLRQQIQGLRPTSDSNNKQLQKLFFSSPPDAHLYIAKRQEQIEKHNTIDRLLNELDAISSMHLTDNPIDCATS